MHLHMRIYTNVLQVRCIMLNVLADEVDPSIKVTVTVLAAVNRLRDDEMRATQAKKIAPSVVVY